MRNRNQPEKQFHLGTIIRNMIIKIILVILLIVGVFYYFGKTDVLISTVFGDNNKTVETNTTIVPSSIDNNETNISKNITTVKDTRSFAELVKDEQYKCDQMDAELKRWGTPISDDNKSQCIFVRSADIIITKENGMDHYKFNIPSGGN